MFTLFRLKWLLGLIAMFAFLSNFTYIAYLRRENARLKADLTRTSETLYRCYRENQYLLKELKLEYKKYQAKISHLLRLANKPPKVIHIPEVIVKRVYVTPRECRQMAQMIDEFIQIQKAQQKAEKEQK